jgi:hypothetical protein
MRPCSHFPAADTRLTTAIASRDLVARQMSRDQIAEAQKRASEWQPKLRLSSETARR